MKYLLLFLTFSLSPLLLAQNPALSLAELQQKIQTRLSLVEGNFAVAFKDLKTGKTLFLNEKESFHAASTMKVPVMIEVFRQAEAKKFSLSDSVLVKNEFRSIVDGSLYRLDTSDDSDEKMYQRLGMKMTVYDLVFEMITLSSNLATNILIEKVGADSIGKTLLKFGANDMRVLRGVEDQKAFDKGLNNVTTAHDLMVVFERIAEKKAARKKSCESMLDILFAQHFNEMIPAKLPKEVKVAHKTGNIKGVQHDGGIIYLPDGRKYVLVLLSKNLKHEPAGVQALAEVSEMIFEWLK